jgi:hypothetical protein
MRPPALVSGLLAVPGCGVAVFGSRRALLGGTCAVPPSLLTLRVSTSSDLIGGDRQRTAVLVELCRCEIASVRRPIARCRRDIAILRKPCPPDRLVGLTETLDRKRR